jgi:hypothetical protein
MASSPPLTPIRNYMDPLSVSPSSSYREQLRRRNSSFSSNHDRSPTSTRSRHRYSTASNFSNELHTPIDESFGGGGGNLADELDQLDDDEYDDDTLDELPDTTEKEQEGEVLEGARDSGIDVSYSSKRSSPTQSRNFSKPFAQSQKPPDEVEQVEERFTPELEDCLHAIQRMASYADGTEDPLVPRAIAQMQDLGNQTTLENMTQRMNTSTNSVSSHVGKETKALQALSATLYTPLIFSAPLDPNILEEISPLIETLLASLPLPDPAVLTAFQKLSRETESTVNSLSQLTDTIQMGKQSTNAAARHLRSTQTVLVEMRHERERADAAREELAAGPWQERIGERWCKRECDDVISGFENTCAALRESLVLSVEAAGA